MAARHRGWIGAPDVQSKNRRKPADISALFGVIAPERSCGICPVVRATAEG